MYPRTAAPLALAAILSAGVLSLVLAAEPAAPAPTRVTLQGDKVPLSKVLADLSAQSGEPVADRRGDADVTISLDLQKVIFWQALDAAAEAADARVDLHARDGRLALVKRPAGAKPLFVSYSGLFRTTVRRLVASRDLETGGVACTASLEVAWEPRLLPILLETRPHSLVVHDDKGGDLSAGNREGSSLAPVDGRISLAFDVSLPPAPRPAATLGLLQGELYAVAPSKMLTFRFDPLDALARADADDPTRRPSQEGVTCRVSRVVLADDHWTVQTTLDYPEGNVKLDTYQSWVVNNQMVLESKDGKDHFSPDEYLLESSSTRQAVLSYHFRDKEKLKKGPSAWRPVYRAPALVVKVPFTFAFKDVPLP